MSRETTCLYGWSISETDDITGFIYDTFNDDEDKIAIINSYNLVSRSQCAFYVG